MYCKYKVMWYDSSVSEERTEEGIVGAKTFGEAADNIAEDYGIEQIIDIDLYFISDERCLDKDEIEWLFNK